MYLIKLNITVQNEERFSMYEQPLTVCEKLSTAVAFCEDFAPVKEDIEGKGVDFTYFEYSTSYKPIKELQDILELWGSFHWKISQILEELETATKEAKDFIDLIRFSKEIYVVRLDLCVEKVLEI